MGRLAAYRRQTHRRISWEWRQVRIVGSGERGRKHRRHRSAQRRRQELQLRRGGCVHQTNHWMVILGRPRKTHYI